MTAMWPLILRELRGSSRRWTSYWLRLLGAGAVIVAVVLLMPNAISSTKPGGELLVWMHRIIILAIWVLVPLMACDCLSSEKREGTLGLLFMTNLRAQDIVVAKAAVHGLRALTLWLAAVPIIGIALLMGGLTRNEIVVSCVFAFTSICFALSMALIVSSCARRANEAAFLAVGFGLIGFAAHALFLALVISGGFLLLHGSPWSTRTAVFWPGLVTLPYAGCRFLLNLDGTWNTALPFRSQFIAILLSTVPLALVVLALAVRASGFVLRRNWQDRPKTRRQTEVENAFFQPRFGKQLFRRWMTRTLERNPIGWLELRTWHGRIAAMVWLAIMVSFASAIAGNPQLWMSERGPLNGLMQILIVTVSYVAAVSFRRERENGAMELILVTPLSTLDILFGRLAGLWLQFLPAVLVWLGVKLFLSHVFWTYRLGHSSQGGPYQSGETLYLVLGYMAIPVVGLFFSLRCRYGLVAWGATLATWYLVPQLVTRGAALLCGLLMDQNATTFFESVFIYLGLPLQLAITALLAWRLYTNLARRSFSLRIA